MKNALTGTVIAAALALSSLAPAPARAADAEDVLKLVLGIGAIYVIGKAIENKPARAAPVYRQENRSDASRHKVVPAECLRTYETRNGPVRGYSKPCLEQELRRPARLPEACEMTLRTEYGRRDIYAPRCLRREGWQIAQPDTRHRDGRRAWN